MRLVLGEMSTVVLDTQKVLPNKLHALGFEFKFNNLKNALDDLVKAKKLQRTKKVYKMKDNQLTYILLIIASILLILNGIFAFDHTIAMILMSLLCLQL